MSASKKVALIGAPWCAGQNLEGADLAPTAIRDGGLATAIQDLGLAFTDHGDVNFTGLAPMKNHQKNVALLREWESNGHGVSLGEWIDSKRGTPSTRKRSYEDLTREEDAINVKNAITMGAGLELIHDKVRSVLSPSDGGDAPTVVTVGGDHSIAASSISALVAKYPSLGVIWVDAHADANTPRTSPSGHYHGMPAAHLLGWFDKPGEMSQDDPSLTSSDLRGFEWLKSGCLKENKLAYIGLRDVDKEEGMMLRRSGVRVFTMRDVDKYGIAKVIEMAIDAVGPSMDCPLHLSLDIDAVDPAFAPGTGTVSRGGLTYREIHYICEEIALTKRLASLDLVEVNPVLDPPANPPIGPNGAAAPPMHGDNPAIAPSSPPTVRLAIELILSALGKQIC